MDYTYNPELTLVALEIIMKKRVSTHFKRISSYPTCSITVWFIVLATNPDGSFGTKKYFRSKKFGRPTDSFGC